MNHEGRWLEIFQLDRGNLPIWRKKTKTDAAKRGSEKAYLEALEKEIKSQTSRPPKRGRSAGDF